MSIKIERVLDIDDRLHTLIIHQEELPKMVTKKQLLFNMEFSKWTIENVCLIYYKDRTYNEEIIKKCLKKISRAFKIHFIENYTFMSNKLIKRSKENKSNCKILFK